jgi:neutral amino acid transport system permease protein
LLLFVEWLPVAESENQTFIKTLQVSNVLLTLSIFSLMAFSLNLHTGVTGMVNFGVIFFVGVGAITVGILTAPKDLHGYDWPIFWAVVAGVLLSAVFGWLLAYPTARLRMDYFAIVTISLGEIVRVLLMGEPLLRAGSWGSSIGISRYPMPFENWWFCGSTVPNKRLMGSDFQFGTADDIIQPMTPDDCAEVVGIGSPAELLGRSSGNYTNVEVLNQTSGFTDVSDIVYEATPYSMELGQPAPYMMMLAIIGIVSLIAIWWLLETVLKSPWGRILRSIREDEEVAQHHGHDVLTHKAASLAFGAAIAGFAGALWAWKLTGFQPSFMAPARSTFLVWAAFVIGGAANNKGMIIGAFIYVIMEFVFNVLVAGQGSSDLPLNETAAMIDRFFEWLVTSSELWFWPHFTPLETFLAIGAIGLLINKWGMVETSLCGAVVFIVNWMLLGERSIDEGFIGAIEADMAYVKVLLIGLMIVFSLKYNPKGLLPEVPSRPPRRTGGEAE